MKDLIVRFGTKADIPAALTLIQELAQYENSPESVKVTEQQLEEDGFGSFPAYKFLVASSEDKIVGLALFYYRYSTWKGKGLYLEDLIVTEKFRGKGVGRSLFLETANYARQQSCTGLYWQVLDWNEPAIEFYKTLGAELDDEWINCKLDQEGLNRIK